MHSELAFEGKKTWTGAFGLMTADLTKGEQLHAVCFISTDNNKI